MPEQDAQGNAWNAAMIKIGANISSQTVQRNLARSSTELSISSERLTSGQRINRAADDAAGLAIGTNLRIDARVLKQGIRNLNDGISAISIAESAMTSLQEVGGRIQELTTQGMNSTFGASQRKSMQSEINALQAEWNRIVDSTSFNNTNLLTGNNTRIVLQGGKGVDGTLALQVGAAVLSEAFGAASSGETTRASVSTTGSESNGTSSRGGLSADGTLLVFQSDANNLISGVSGTQLYVRNLVTGQLSLVSQSAGGIAGNGSSIDPKVSSDGRYVVFESTSSNLVAGASGTQSYIKDLASGSISVASQTQSGTNANAAATTPTVSGNGRYVTFASSATNLISGVSGLQVYRKDLTTGELSLVSSSSSGTAGNGSNDRPALSDDGRYVVFEANSTNLGRYQSDPGLFERHDYWAN